ncbi:uncharacterized protein PFL1_01801 [Pseudozyma flocculosa PF-1]|uniref:Related to sulfatases n=1 Tax=Pseudozyma flocculosa TaxID=84751 RepID=A0A5C3EWU6_9BASI|nr:uncharacterized protein PFL1_01801 [Pseudozyma flocculosa PF-1]EPQ30903.1 hypothetical protein PFL1_01801 [Pseudozyma flocculosa PF-1]SPO36714.1 related to sulfatases [Pseudozyma flocculosa]
MVVVSSSFLTTLLALLLLTSATSATPAQPRGAPPASNAASLSSPSSLSRRAPNFIYILSDDQDAASATRDVMPHLARTLSEGGSNYTHFYTPMSICCPSRVGFLRSQHGHSHNVTYVSAPFGGWERYVELGYRDDALPSWLQRAGYHTSYVGKLMNGNTLTNAQSVAVHGFNRSEILLDPHTYAFTNATYSVDGGPPENRPGEYSTDHIRDVGLSMLDEAVKSDQPFFVGIAPIGPHAELLPADKSVFLPPVSAPRHAHLFPDATIPRTPSFNPDRPSGAYTIRNLTRLDDEQVAYLDEWYRLRLRSLQSVDELIGAVVDRAEQLGILDNTYIIYSSDNGYTLGSHRRQPGKTTGYEQDIRVPFFVRGPGVPAGGLRDDVHSNIDVSATIAHLAGVETQYELDGRVMPWARPVGREGKHDKSIGTAADGVDGALTGTSTHHLSEYWVYLLDEGKYAGEQQAALYRALRVKDDGANWAYTVWCNGERELYDMNVDPHQMNNLLLPPSTNGTALAEPFAPLQSRTSSSHRVATRLDALLLNLKNCKGRACRELWTALFPRGEVQSLRQALKTEWDAYFDAVPRLHYTNCTPGFRRENELPDWSDDLAYDGAKGKGPK